MKIIKSSISLILIIAFTFCLSMPGIASYDNEISFTLETEEENITKIVYDKPATNLDVAKFLLDDMIDKDCDVVEISTGVKNISDTVRIETVLYVDRPDYETLVSTRAFTGTKGAIVAVIWSLYYNGAYRSLCTTFLKAEFYYSSNMIYVSPITNPYFYTDTREYSTMPLSVYWNSYFEQSHRSLAEVGVIAVVNSYGVESIIGCDSSGNLDFESQYIYLDE